MEVYFHAITLHREKKRNKHAFSSFVHVTVNYSYKERQQYVPVRTNIGSTWFHGLSRVDVLFILYTI